MVADGIPALPEAPGFARLASTRRTSRRLGVSCWLGGVMLAFLLPLLPAWERVENLVFDAFSVSTAAGRSQLPITIIGIDEASFTQLGLRWPWPRAVHAELVKRLVADGAAVIAFDVLFSEPSSVADDAAFATAIGEAGNVVLAADFAFHETMLTRQWLRQDPVPVLTQAGARTGLATQTLRQDTVSRLFAQQPDAFWRRVVETLIEVRPGSVTMPYVPPDAMIRHLGPAHTFPYVPYYQALGGGEGLPAGFFADQVVLVGKDVRAATASGTTQGDSFATPFLGVSQLLTPGVEIQATMIENALMGQAIGVLAPGIEAALGLGCLVLLLPLFWFWRPLWGLVALIAASAVVGGVAYALFLTPGVFLRVVAPISGMWAAVLAMGVASYWQERRRAAEIRQLFGMYVSNDVVSEMIAHPERIRLGGEQREITVLFADLANFTAVSERLAPDEVANMINLYLEAMTTVILSSGGTVDKYIGDAIMAFWGAPLPDPDHALHAVSSAVAMQAAMADLQPTLARMGLGGLSVRIGVHSGLAVVGNMGSSRRFDYTALGDTVNLASRLEGVNKRYRTGVLLSEATVRQLGSRVTVRRVDRVRVQGKAIPVDVYTPCPDLRLIALTSGFWQAFLERRWLAAREVLDELAFVAPGDTIETLLRQRLADCMAVAPAANWDGSVALEK